MNNKLEVVEVPITNLKPSEYNPRKWDKIDIGQLTESIRRFGIVDPLIANSAPERKNILVGGNFRFSVLKELGYETVPVVVP